MSDFVFVLELAVRKYAAVQANAQMCHQKSDQNKLAIGAQNQVHSRSKFVKEIIIWMTENGLFRYGEIYEPQRCMEASAKHKDRAQNTEPQLQQRKPTILSRFEN